LAPARKAQREFERERHGKNVRNEGYCCKTVNETLSRMISSLSSKENAQIRDMTENDLILFHFGLGEEIRHRFRLWPGNKELLK
jgi:hypothetical protein